VRLDAMKIEQVFLNIFSNAAQAMDEGGRLTVRTTTRQVTGIGENVSDSDRFRPGARLVIIEVLDTGSGVPEALIGKIFEPFFTTKPTGKGTGLGLTVTKTIVDLHGGTIEIGNRPEGGACVTLTFNAEGDPAPKPT
jgi:signal transduction histidine kinase